MFNQSSIQRLIAVLGFGLCLLFTVSAQNTEVSYIEGSPRLRDGAGALSILDYGILVRTGDSIITGRSDQVELIQGDAATITVWPDTVFTIREMQVEGQNEQVLTAAAGAVGMRFNRLAGREPRVGTVATVAGIRGTELRIYAGPDGSSLFVVDSGLVFIETDSSAVELGPDQAVEVSATGLAGEVFSVIGRETSHADWVDARTQLLLKDPVAALLDVRFMLSDFRSGLEEWVMKYNEAKIQSDAAYAELVKIEDKEKQTEYRDEVWTPLSIQTGNAVLNYRYYALSALSIRRYVLGPLYVQMRSRNMLKQDASYQTFMDEYAALLEEFRSDFGPYLNSLDY